LAQKYNGMMEAYQERGDGRGVKAAGKKACEVNAAPLTTLKKNRSAPNTAVIPVLYYPDVREAVEWLTTALPCTERLRIADHRYQLLHSNGAIVIAKPGGHANAASSTQQSPGAHSVMLRVTGIDVLFERAKAAGARVLAEPADHIYGERQCSFLDPWGHPWTLSETIFDSDPADWGGELLVE
jgi:uncharacterized glyoxalase superfamily protein PhnB